MPLRALSAALLAATAGARYNASWASLDARPNPSWFADAKVGIFIHMGVFSVPSFHGEWFWSDLITAKDPDVVAFVATTENPSFVYPDYAPRLTYELFNATAWAELFSASGARYVVPTTKHHEGFAMWPSAQNYAWNSMMVGPKRDVYGELVAALRALPSPPKVGAYHSLFEWYNPLFLADQAANFTTRVFPDTKTLPELYDLVNTYKPELIWSDGDCEFCCWTPRIGRRAAAIPNPNPRAIAIAKQGSRLTLGGIARDSSRGSRTTRLSRARSSGTTAGAETHYATTARA